MRKVRNWLDAFEDWASNQNAECPLSFIRWSGLLCLASVTKRNIWTPESLMGSYAIYPNQFIFFVGPPGGPRKTTALNFAKSMLKRVDAINIVPKQISASDLVRYMTETKDGSVSVLSGEVSSFLNTTIDDTVDLLTDLYDNDDVFDRGTRAHGQERIENPSVNILACTTPDWIASKASQHFVGGGFASRIIFVYEETTRGRRMYYKINTKDIGTKRSNLVDTLKHIAELKGAFRHENNLLKEEMETWYREELPNEVHHKMAGYYNRKHSHLHKIMMVLSVAERDDLVFSVEHFVKAKEILAETEESMYKAVAYAGNNPTVGMMDKITHFISRSGKTTYKEIWRHFYQDIENEAELGRILGALVSLDEVKVTIPPNSAPIDRIYTSR